MKLQDIIKNKVVFYLASRYVTYGVQFLTSLVIAVKLGPFYMGIWGFILLLLQYFQQLHFGIANSFNVLYVHHRENERESNNYIVNSLILISWLGLFVILFYLYYNVYGISNFDKYRIKEYVVWICLIAILRYYVQFFVSLFRVNNQLNRVAFCQSIVVILNFVCLFFFKGEELITALIAGYVIGNLMCVVLAATSGSVPKPSHFSINIKYQKEILKKGLFLFLYNSCFYFIIISIRTIISGNYTVEEFGMFTFSFSLAQAILLLLEALSFVIFPKVIGKLSSNNPDEVKSTILLLRSTYVPTAHLLIYIALPLFPFIIILMPKFEGSLMSMNLIALTVLMLSNSYGFLELLVAKNKEKTIAVLSAFSLLLNIIIANILVKFMHVTFSYVIFSTMVTYYIFTLVAVYLGKKGFSGLNIGRLFEEHFPLRLAVPYSIAIIISLLQYECIAFLPLLCFLIFNRKYLLNIFKVTKTLIVKPDVVNL